MKKFWLVFKHEYLRHVKRKRFIFAILSLPILILFILGVGFLSVYLGIDSRPVAVVDQSGLFTTPLTLPTRNDLFSDVQIIPYSDEAAANQALESGIIQGIFTIQPDYAQTGKVTLASKEPLDSTVTNDFQRFLTLNLLAEQPVQVRERIIEGPELVVHSAERNQGTNANNPIVFIVALVAGILFIMAINTSGGYLLQALIEEKENRTMEIIVTSLSPTQLMAGKIMGNLSVGLTQLVIWILTGVAGFLIARRFIPDMGSWGMDWSFLWILLATFLPAFVMIAALMALVGATAIESREAQQISGLFTLPIVAPLWFIGALIANPNSGLAIILSLFPLTSPLTLPIRAALTAIPAWQIATAWALLVLSALVAIWLASKAFHTGLLNYGKKLRLAELFRKAR